MSGSPVDFPDATLGTLLADTRNGIYKHEKFYGRGVRILKMFNIGRLDGRWDLSRVDMVELSSDEAEAYRLREGDILFNRVNSRELVGKCAVVSADLDGCVFESKNMRLRFDLKKAYPRYIALLLNGELGRQQIQAKVRQIAGMATLNRADVESISLPTPSIADQRRIASALDAQLAAIEQARAATKRRVEAAEALEGAILREAFHGLTPVVIGAPAALAPAGWEWHRLTDMARLESGHTPSRRHPEWWGGGIPWIALPDIRGLDGKVAMETKERTNALGLANSSARVLPAGTVVFSRTASVGFVTIMGREMATSQDFVNWVCGPAVSPQLLLHALRASRSHLVSQASGAVHKTLYMPAVKDFTVCFPTGSSVQDGLAARIDARLADSSTLVSAARAELAAIEALPAAALRRVFSPTS